MPIVTRSAIDEGPNQKVVNVIRTIMRLGVKTEANLFAIFRFMWMSMTRTEKFSAVVVTPTRDGKRIEATLSFDQS